MRHAHLALAVLVAASCGSSDPGAARCVEGASVACTCASGTTGAQVCDARGIFGPCSCASGDATAGMVVSDGGQVALEAGADSPASPPRALDILFMIDDSPSMEEEQANLVRNFPVFMQQLRQIPGGLPDLHLAVVTSDLGAGSIPLSSGGCPRIGGDRGIFHAPSCGLDGNAIFVSSLHNGTMNNFQGTLESVFKCMATVGVQGCGYEHQLQSTRLALDESLTRENAGFLRPDALLAIVLITDEDDCSADRNSTLFTDDASFPGTTPSFRCAQAGHLCDGQSPPVAPFMAPLDHCTPNPAGRLLKVQEIADAIKSLKQRPAEQIFVSGIFGWPDTLAGAQYVYGKTPEGLDYSPTCGSLNGSATAGLRLKQFVEAFGTNGTFSSICQDNFSPALQKIGEALAARL